MPRKLTPATSTENLKKEAKRWLRELSAGDDKARARLRSAWPKAPAEPVLRDVQHALAREFGIASWIALKQALAERSPAEREHAELVADFLHRACPDWRMGGGPHSVMNPRAAERMLRAHPEIARENLLTSIVCGELQNVQRILAENPKAATEDSGPKQWPPILYCCAGRLELPAFRENSVEIARVLLDHGADPNSFFFGGNELIHYTAFTLAVGQGEEDIPLHPRAHELVGLLLERGAEPYDQQVLYNANFRGDMQWCLELMYEHSVRRGRIADWQEPTWRMLDMGGYGCGARYLLTIAMRRNNLQFGEWLLAHGASPDPPSAPKWREGQRSLYQEALGRGLADFAELLVRYGAPRATIPLTGEEAFGAACFRLDRAAAEAMLREHPEYRESHAVLHEASRSNRPDVIDLLLDLGVSPDIRSPRSGDTGLHAAAYSGSAEAAALLIQRGAKIDPVDSVHDGTPLWFAMWGRKQNTIDVIAPHSRDLWSLSATGNVERIREVLAAEPELAKMTDVSTPLHWLPDDEQKAATIVDLLLANGADASFCREQDGKTAAELARERGLREAAEKLEQAARTHSDKAQHDLPTYEQAARDFVAAHDNREETALARLNQHYERNFNFDDLFGEIWRRNYAYRQRSSRVPKNYLPLEEAQMLVAQDVGYSSWAALVKALETGSPPLPAFEVDEQEKRITPRRRLRSDEWDELITTAKERGATQLGALGLMSDDVIKRVASLENVTALSLGGSHELSDDGLLQLANMPQLEQLDLSEYPGGKLTDRGMEVLRHLPNLRVLEMTWQRGVTDAGVANLRFCENLEKVNLMGTPTGDGAIAALRGKPKLRHFSSGRLVSDAGLALLHDFPQFKTWHGPEVVVATQDAINNATHLLLDGPITDAGIARLRGLDGVFELALFWHANAITPEAFRHLTGMANLGSVRCDGERVNDVAMGHISLLPRLRWLIAQGTTATDDGFAALSRSRTLEYLWTRETPNLTGRGFLALSRLPALRSLGVSCKQVDDAALAALPDFPALIELTPIDVTDDGFRHVGRCQKLERLTCMYCRTTGDAATEHIRNLKLKHYYAGLTQITDRSLEIMGTMPAFEQIELYECLHVTDTGLPYLAKLPKLRELHLDGLPQVTLAGTQVFPKRVRVRYSTG